MTPGRQIKTRYSYQSGTYPSIFTIFVFFILLMYRVGQEENGVPDDLGTQGSLQVHGPLGALTSPCFRKDLCFLVSLFHPKVHSIVEDRVPSGRPRTHPSLLREE